MKRLLLIVPVMFSLSVLAQFTPPPVCNPEFAGKMICVLPEVYGPYGMSIGNVRHSAHFGPGAQALTETSNFQSNFTPLTLALGTEASLQNLSSPASGVVFSLDRSLGVVTRSMEGYGPIATERAETIGRHRIYLAGTYQYYSFSTLDDIDLKHLPSVISHVEFPIGGTIPPWEHDFVATDNRLDLKVHQFTLYGTFGLTNRIDISAAVPILDVRLALTSSAHIVRVAPPSPGDPSAEPITGQFHYFDVADPNGSIDKTFKSAATASGIGDVTLRVKGTLMKAERARVALGLDLKAPTGDELNFLGSGAVGVKPFVAASYRSRISPHANLAFQWNGTSALGGNVALGTSAKLPNQFFYSFGADAAITRKLTAAADIVGQRVSNTARLRAAPYVDEFGTSYPEITQSTLYHDSLTMNELALGAKFSPFGNLLMTGNVLLRLNKAGLRAKAVPMVGISYSF